ncbi:hypothetical protein [Nonomuraea sp. NPDC003709]|uniref:hypothetical protein n=1 Tax=Nonomuraea sp. NPDC003709 TaxID=3154450 RepID=UPI0033ABD8B9
MSANTPIPAKSSPKSPTCTGATGRRTSRWHCTWTFEYGLPVLVLRGFSSETYVRRVRERLAADPRPAVLAYVGDYDASGEAILTDWLARTSGCWLAVEQIALTHEQVLEYGLPAAPGKARSKTSSTSPVNQSWS